MFDHDVKKSPAARLQIKNGAVKSLNPQKIAILADSCCDVPVEEAAEKGFFIVPLRILGDDGEHADGVNIFASDIYRRLAAGETLKTSLPAGAAVEHVLNEIKAQGYEKVIALMLSSGLSGTYNLLRVTAQTRDDLELAVFDTKSASIGISMVIYQLQKDIASGMDWNQLTAQRVPQLLENTHAYFSVDTLEYLQKGGRIGLISAMAGTMLNIKPILTFAQDGQLTGTAKVRGTKQVIARLTELLRQHQDGHKRFNLAVTNGGDPANMELLRAQMQQAFPDCQFFWDGTVGSTLSVYIGPGMLGVSITVLD